MKPITYIKGDATQPAGSGVKFITHCCNNFGLWGAGFVLALSARWSEPKQAFKEKKSRELGEVQLVPVGPDLYVANLIGQHGVVPNAAMVPPVRYEAIAEGFEKLANLAMAYDASIHMPRMGCGLAGGKWRVVEGLIKCKLSSQDISVTVYDL